MGGQLSKCLDCIAPQQQVLDAGQYMNPVIDSDFPDPFVLKYRDHWLAYGTNASGGNVQIARSSDLVNWQRLPDALPRLPSWARGGLTWAPCCCCIPSRQGKDTFVLYFVARENATDKQSIGVAVCDRPEGPFEPKGDRPLISTPDEGGSIDPSCCPDQSGRCILFWKNDGNAIGRECWIRAQPMTPDGLQFDGPEHKLIRNDQPWEGHVIEAPFPFRRGFQWYLFYSGNDYGSPAYAVSYATAANITGPYKKSGDPILRSCDNCGPVIGPGACSLTEVNGVTWMLYHSWCPGQRYRAMNIARVDWDPQGHPHIQPSYGQPRPAPFS